MKFISTRGSEAYITSQEAILKGICEDGGLYVPEYFPNIYEKLKENIDISYEELACKVIGEFFTDFSLEEISESVKAAYEGRFEVKVRDEFIELFHGPTCAFKDAALLFLPQIMKRAKKKLGKKEEVVILTATSGDTGKAALEGFKDVEGFKVVVYYPNDGVSEIQEKQMLTQEGDNTCVIGIDGNFDDAQTGVKNIFVDEVYKEELKKRGILLSSANSINIGRLVPQIVYYFYSYFKLLQNNSIKDGEKINVVVPTGNFGNILAAYYGKQMGLPLDKLICASNENNVLTDFFKTGSYNKNRELKLTTSPSMDILVSSNFERLLFEAYKRDGQEVNKLMKELNKNGSYTVSEENLDIFKDFYGAYASEEEVLNGIAKVYEKKGYLMDTHTSVGYVALEKYREETGDLKEALIASTASPFKFPRSICEALSLDVVGKSDFEVLKILSENTKNVIPNSLSKLEKMDNRHFVKCDKGDMRKELEEYMGGK